MATNLGIDDRLVEEARKMGNHTTKNAAINEALAEYIQRRRQTKILGIFNAIDYDPGYDYKEQRKKT